MIKGLPITKALALSSTTQSIFASGYCFLKVFNNGNVCIVSPIALNLIINIFFILLVVTLFPFVLVYQKFILEIIKKIQ